MGASSSLRSCAAFVSAWLAIAAAPSVQADILVPGRSPCESQGGASAPADGGRFVPGIDSRGRPVAPADLPALRRPYVGSSAGSFDTATVPPVDLRLRLDLGAATGSKAGLVEGDVDLGRITMEGGAIRWDGAPPAIAPDRPDTACPGS